MLVMFAGSKRLLGVEGRVRVRVIFMIIEVHALRQAAFMLAIVEMMPTPQGFLQGAKDRYLLQENSTPISRAATKSAVMLGKLCLQTISENVHGEYI